MKIIVSVILVLLVPYSLSVRFTTKPRMRCGENHLGKLIEVDQESHKVYKICVSPERSETYFVYHKLGFRFRNGLTEGKDDPCQANIELKTTEYSRIVDLFDKQRNSVTFQKQGLHNQLDFSQLQLAPCADFEDPQEKLGTFFVENTLPSFNKVLNGNWAFIENSVRSKIKEDTEILTGKFGHLILTNNDGLNVSLVLEDTKVGQTKNIKQPYNEVKVPEFFYKIVKNSRSSYVIITSNNPFITTLTDEQRMCKTDLCSTPSRLKDFSLGYTYCCPLPQFAVNMKLLYNTDFNGVLFHDHSPIFNDNLAENHDGPHDLQKVIDLI